MSQAAVSERAAAPVLSRESTSLAAECSIPEMQQRTAGPDSDDEEHSGATLLKSGDAGANRVAVAETLALSSTPSLANSRSLCDEPERRPRRHRTFEIAQNER